MSSERAFLLLIALVALERGNELRLTRGNRARALARGGRDGEPRWQYLAIVAFHALFLVAAPAEVYLLSRPFQPALGLTMLVFVLLAQGLRYWAIQTLGERWMTRVVVVPGDLPVVGGPYRWVRHPNYLAVIVEVAALPLVHGAWWTALAGSALHAGLLFLRVRSEEKALSNLKGYDAAFARTGRLLPRFRKED
jgi:methyltransferase